MVTVVAICIFASIGYLTATVARPSVEKEIRDYVLSEGIRGVELGGREVSPEEIPVTSYVKWPFVVVVSYAVPFDLHFSYCRTTYLVLPWARYVLTKQRDSSI